jgi:beta-lactamase regulating signal transducer with metallopeptidase domain
LLDDHQLAAALAHERAHLDQHHDLVIAWAAGLARAFPRVGLFARGLSESRRLVELLADDVATRSSDRLTLAEALLNLAGSRTPAAALGASGAAAARVQRLIAPRRPLTRRSRAGTVLGVVGLFAAPLIALATPAVAATHLNYCPTRAAQAAHVSPPGAALRH